MSITYASAQLVGVLVGEELVAPGTEAATVDKVLGAQTLGHPHDINEYIQLRTMGGGRNIYHDIPGAKNFSFDLEFALQYGNIFYYAMGAVDDVFVDPHYTHTCTLNTPLPSLTIEGISTDLAESRKYLGSKINELTLSAAKQEAVKATANFLCMDSIEDVTPGTPASTDVEPFIWEESTLTLDSVEYAGILENFELSIVQNLVPLFTHGNRNPVAIMEGELEITAMVEIALVDNTLQSLFRDETEFSLNWELIRTATSDQITIEADKCRVTEYDSPYDMGADHLIGTAQISIAREDIDAVCADGQTAY